jgi:hypothetical protein
MYHRNCSKYPDRARALCFDNNNFEWRFEARRAQAFHYSGTQRRKELEIKSLPKNLKTFASLRLCVNQMFELYRRLKPTCLPARQAHKIGN